MRRAFGHLERLAGPAVITTQVLASKGRAIAFGALLAGSLMPIWMVTVPALDDYPNHLARIHVLLNSSASAALNSFYQVQWGLIPNLGMDLVVPLLAQAMPLEVAGKLFLTLTLVLICTGTLALHHAVHERFSAWPLLIFLLLYNGIFLFGILNYLFGVGLALWAFALWIHGRRRPKSWRMAVFYASCLVLFFAHLSALGVFSAAVLAYELGRGSAARRERLRWLVVLTAAPAGLLAVLWAARVGETSEASFLNYGPLSFAVTQKIGAAGLLFQNYWTTLDQITVGAIAWLVALGLMSRRMRLHPHGRWPVIALGAAFALMPYQIMGSNFADARVLLAAAIVFITMSDWSFSERMARLFVVGVVAVAGIRLAVVAHAWHQSERDLVEVAEAAELVPSGSRVFAAWLGDPARPNELPGPHIAAIMVMKRNVFLPSVYAAPGAQPLAFSERYRNLAKQAPKPGQWRGDARGWSHIGREYDYIFIVRPDRFEVLPATEMREVYRGRVVQLLRTPRSPRPADSREADCRDLPAGGERCGTRNL